MPEKLLHTQGTWAICEKVPNGSWYSGLTIYWVEGGMRIGDASPYAFHGEEGAKANARMMAASLAMFQGMQKILELKPDFTSPEVFYHAVRDIARECIAKTEPKP